MTSEKGRGRPWAALVVGACLRILSLAAATTAVAAVLFGLLAAGAAAIMLLGLLAGLAAGIIFHELGHVTCAAIASIPVYRIVIGAGPLLWRGHLGEVRVELRAWPIAGRVELCPVLNCRWYWSVFFLLGGVLGNLAVVSLLWGLYAAGFVTGWANQIVLPVIAAQAFLLAVNLRPVSRRGMMTDGMLLVQLVRTGAYYPSRVFRKALETSYGKANTPLTMTAASSRLMRHLAQFHHDKDARPEARAAMLRQIHDGELSHEEEAYVLDTLVTQGLVFGDAAARPFLDDWSRQAVALFPDRPTLRGSRGAALVECGRCEEGKALLAPLAVLDQANSFDSFMSRAFFAIAEHRLGNVAAAHQFADAARATADAAGNARYVTEMLLRLDREIREPSDGERD